MERSLEIEMLKARKALLTGRGKANQNICKKIDRRINKLETK